MRVAAVAAADCSARGLACPLQLLRQAEPKHIVS